MPERMSNRDSRLKNVIPSSEVLSRPRSATAAGTLRTVMSPMDTRSSVTGATRATPLAVVTACVKSLLLKLRPAR